MTSIVALCLLLVLLMFVLVLIAHKAKPRMDKTYFIKHWKAIEEKEDYSIAVLKADSLVDEAMKRARIKGNTTGERLNNSIGFLKNVNATWSAHKLRNRIAHDHEKSPTASECQKALRQFKKALKDLGAL